MTVRELLIRMDAAEFAEWMAFNAIEPFGDEWRPVAQVTAVVANHLSGKQFTADDWMPIEAKPKVMSSAAIKAVLTGMANHGGNSNQPKRPPGVT